VSVQRNEYPAARIGFASTAEMQLPGTPADQVLAQSPPANAEKVAAPKTSLLVTVASDPPAYVMPSCRGSALGSVSRTLQDGGLQTGKCQHGSCGRECNSRVTFHLRHPGPAIAGSIIVTQTPASRAESPGGRHGELRSAVNGAERSRIFSKMAEKSIAGMAGRGACANKASGKGGRIIPNPVRLVVELLKLGAAVDESER